MSFSLFKKLNLFWEKLEKKKHNFKNWFVERAEGAHARLWLMLMSFTEASFFLVPPDILLVAIILAGTGRWAHYSFITTLFSVLGGVFGFFIGMFLFGTLGEGIIATYNLENDMMRIASLFEENAFIAIFTASFTPLPYKVFTLSAGFFSISFIKFLIASILGRGLRFFIIGYFANKYRNILNGLILKYFNYVSIALVSFGVLFVLFSKVL